MKYYEVPKNMAHTYYNFEWKLVTNSNYYIVDCLSIKRLL